MIDLGPGAGRLGGELVAQRHPARDRAQSRFAHGPVSIGARRSRILTPRRRGQRQPPGGARRARAQPEEHRRRVPARHADRGDGGFRQRQVDADQRYSLPGAGARRSTAHARSRARMTPSEGSRLIDKVIAIDQSPIGRTPRSNPATYTGVFTPIRDLYAMLPESRERGYKPGRFSFNVKGGRCEACQGDGLKRIEMNFLPDVYVTCDVCRGRRYNHETLQVKYKGHSIADLLEATVEERSACAGEHSADSGEAADAARCGTRLHPPGAVFDDAVGRGSAAHQAGARIEPAADRAHLLYPRRADHRAAFRRRTQAARCAPPAGRSGQHSCGDRAPIWT